VAVRLLAFQKNILPVHITGGDPSARTPDGRAATGWAVVAPQGLHTMFVLEDVALLCEEYRADGRRNTREVMNEMRSLMLSGKPDLAASDFMRFSVNTVFGLGVLDWATEMGLEAHHEDFGQTLGTWGIGPGAYLVLPLLGPSNLRDTAALPLDGQATPEVLIDNVATRNSATGLRIVNTRADLLKASGMLDDIAFDKYLFVRDAYLQRRRSLVHDGNPPPEPEEADDAAPAEAGKR